MVDYSPNACIAYRILLKISITITSVKIILFHNYIDKIISKINNT